MKFYMTTASQASFEAKGLNYGLLRFATMPHNLWAIRFLISKFQMQYLILFYMVYFIWLLDYLVEN